MLNRAEIQYVVVAMLNRAEIQYVLVAMLKKATTFQPTTLSTSPSQGSLARFRIPGDGNVLGGLTGERSFLSRGGGMPGDGTVFSSDGRLRPNVKNGPF